MLYKQTPVKITGCGLAAGRQVFYRRICGFFLQCNHDKNRYDGLAHAYQIEVLKASVKIESFGFGYKKKKTFDRCLACCNIAAPCADVTLWDVQKALYFGFVLEATLVIANPDIR